MSRSLLQLSGVEKYYGAFGVGVHAVKNLDMTVEAGEIVALLGSSGCGKTSTLRMISGFEAVSAGTITINGRAIHQLPPVRRNVAMAFEGYSLYPPLTVRENISFALTSSKLNRDDIKKRVGEIAQMLEIEDILDRYPVSISGGQQQRASLARALVRDADLHLLDEPMGQLEPQLRALLRGRLKHFIKEQGITAILVTHDQTEANALADRIAVMEEGELQQFDTAAEIRHRPGNLFTGTFIGEPPMNVYPATLHHDAEQLEFRLPEGIRLLFQAKDFSRPALRAMERSPNLMVGVRPYAVQRFADGDNARVVANQWLGDQSHIAADFAGGTLVLVEHDRVDLQPGDTMGLGIAARDLHVFDASSGNALTHGGEPV